MFLTRVKYRRILFFCQKARLEKTDNCLAQFPPQLVLVLFQIHRSRVGADAEGHRGGVVAAQEGGTHADVRTRGPGTCKLLPNAFQIIKNVYYRFINFT